MKKQILFFCFLSIAFFGYCQSLKTPLMGWASWNQFGVKISDKLIMAQADAMSSSGLSAAGFKYINIDDGFFNGRNADGSLCINLTRFPNGMKPVADYIHSKGLKAGFYSEAGANTCGSMYSNDPGGEGAGLYGHDQQDIDSIFRIWGYDFIKVDYCGAKDQKLDEKTRYTAIKQAITNTGRTDINFNVCRWQFPGVWVTTVADSWRMSGDINFTPGSTPKWSSIVSIIDQNKFLAPYCSPGHYNDMDMLEVGRGLTYEEDKSHFTMWCILSSPLLLGNDLRYMSQQTRDLLTNEEVIAINQDTAGLQAHILYNNNNTQVWAKPLNDGLSKERAVVLFNRGDVAASITVTWDMLNLAGLASVRDLWQKKDLGTMENGYTAQVPAHGVVLLKVVGAVNVLKEVFEAEYGWINNFNLTQNSVVVSNQGRAVIDAACSGGAKAGWLGKRADNYIEFRDIYAEKEDSYTLTFSFISGENRSATFSINGKDTLVTNLNSGGWSTLKDISFPVKLKKGYNIVRISNTTDWLPDIDKIRIDLNKGVNASLSVKYVEDQIRIFPNPCNGILSVETLLDIDEINIVSSDGRKVLTTDLKKIDISMLSPGIYMVSVDTKTGSIVKKFVKE